MKYWCFSVCLTGLVLVLPACTPAGSDTEEAAVLEQTENLDVLETGSASQSISTNLVKKSATPSWAHVLELPEFPEGRDDAVKNGLAYLATDDRVVVTEDGYKYFSRAAYKIVERKGLETAAQITRDFDPELSELSFHYVNVIRDGHVQARLDDLEIQELRRESSLGSGIVDGDITAMIQLEDVRVGDIIDYGYSGVTRTPLWPGHYFNAFAISYTVPLARQTFEISIPRATRLTTDTLNSVLRPKITDEGDRTVYLYENMDPEPHKTLSNVPDNVIVKPYVLMSSMSTWQEVSDWAVPVYGVDTRLPADFKARIKAIKKSNKTPEARMVEIFRWVQSDIRYLGIESGINSHKPRTPMVTLDKGYGDCKDKSILLVAALEAMGISAHPVLVSTTSGAILDQLLPSIGNFNHVIVMAEIGGKTYWLDPTLSYQGGSAEDLAPLDYGYVLPIKKGQTGLVKIEVPEIEHPTSVVTETYTLPKGEDSTQGDMSLDVISIYTSTNADAMRRKIASKGRKGLSTGYLDYYEDLYPGLVSTEDLEVDDDFDNNRLVITEHYGLSQENFVENELMDGLIVKASTLNSKLPTSLERDREIPLALPGKLYLKHTIEVKTPGREFIAPEDIEHSQSGIHFVRNYRAENETLYIEYTLKVDEKSVSLVDARDVIELAETIEEEGARTIYPKSAKVSLSKRLKLGFSVPDNVEAQLKEAMVFIQKKENVRALEILNDLEQGYQNKDALRGYIQVLRGAMSADLKRGDAAMPMFEEAFALYDPDTPGVYYTYAGLLRGDEQDVESLGIMRRLFENHSEAVKTVNYKWLWSLTRGVYREEHFTEYDDFMISLAAAQLTHVDDVKKTDQVLDSVVPILGRRNEVELAQTYLPYLKSPSQIRDVLMEKELSSLWPSLEALAGPGLRTAIDAYVEETLEETADHADDFKKKRQRLGALILADRQDEAVSFGAETVKNWSKIEAVGDDAYWFVERYAALLSTVGRNEDGMAMFEKLLDIGQEDHPSLVNVAIDYASSLAMNGQAEKALARIDIYEGIEDFGANDFGWMFLHQAKACAMSELGNSAEALKIYNERTKDITDENIAIHFLALICMDQLDAAEEVLIARLNTKKDRDGTLPIFATANARKDTASFEARLMAKVKQVAARPRVQEVFAVYGRSIKIDGPATYWDEY